MVAQIQIVAGKGVDEGFSTRIKTWVDEVLERSEISPPHSRLCITIWETVHELEAFYREEREALGVVIGDEIDFLATHDAWRGYPRIHICQERLKGIPRAITQGAIHHEIGHALHHGSLEFYTFRFSRTLQETGRSAGFDLPLLQQCAYLLSVAIKDRDVVGWLAKIGLAFSQVVLIEYLVSDTEEERQTWKLVCSSSALRKLALGAFLKTLLPIEAMSSLGLQEAQALSNQWDKAYGWLPEQDRERLSRLAHDIIVDRAETFQTRLEQAVLRLMSLF